MCVYSLYYTLCYFISQSNKVWKYRFDRRLGFTLDRKFPMEIDKVFRGVHANSIDAAVVSVENGDMYFFSGELTPHPVLAWLLSLVIVNAYKINLYKYALTNQYSRVKVLRSRLGLCESKVFT